MTWTPRAAARASTLARLTTSASTTCSNFKIPASPVVTPEPATLIFAQRPAHHLTPPLFARRPRTILAPGAASDQVHVAKTPLALEHLAHARPKISNRASAARGFTVFEPRREGQALTSSGVPATDEGAPRALQRVVRVGVVRLLPSELPVVREVLLHDVEAIGVLSAVEAVEVPGLEVALHDVVRRRSGAPAAGLACR
ncbi:hypothetical protein PF003_g28945 [Phytophthora fragariae]|nr:hypothetical protein PF003_g28945 [Phytophthora fragariae]